MTEEEKQGAVSAAPMEMLNALLSNPELLQRVGSLLGGLGAASVPTSAEGEADCWVPGASVLSVPASLQAVRAAADTSMSMARMRDTVFFMLSSV